MHHRNLFLAALVSLWAFSAHGAELYKWVDENGRTHYSQRNESAGKAKAEQLKISAPAPSAATPIATDVRSAEREKASKPPVAQNSAGAKPASAGESPAARSNAPETDVSKCKLARAVLSGAVRHGNGAPTDTYDRQVAESDVRVFCK